MLRNKPVITNDTVQGLLVIVIGHHRETLIVMAPDMAADTVMVMGATLGATAVSATTDSEVAYLFSVPLLVAFCWAT